MLVGREMMRGAKANLFVSLIAIIFNWTSGEECGDSSLSSFVVKKGDLPWLSLEHFGDDHYCVAYLISSKHVLLTANCVYEIREDVPDNYRILVGQFDSEASEYSTAKVQVAKIHIHPEYSFGKFDNNLAIAVLKEEVLATPVCLPTPKKSIDDIFNKKIYVIGWAPKMENGRAVPTGTAKIAPTVPSDKSLCAESYAGDLNMSSGKYFCTLSRDTRGPCDVDYDGSGIIAKKRGHWQIRGIKLLSHIGDNDQCNPKIPALFIDIAQYVPWITSITDPKSSDSLTKSFLEDK